MISIELLLDPELEARVRADWERLAGAGMSSLGAHRAESNRPHVSLLVRSSLPQMDFDAAVALLPIPISLAKPVVFEHGDRGVLAWSVEPADELRHLHRAIHGEATPGEDAPHTAPGEWTPHVTLARRLRLVALTEAIALIGPPVRGSGVTLRRWDSDAASVTPLSP